MEDDLLTLDAEPGQAEEQAPADPIVELQRRVIDLQQLSELPNAADAVEAERLPGLGQLVVREYQLDKESRSDWEDCARRAMSMAQQKKERKTTPWDGASNVKYPMLTTAALQFAARSYPAIVDGPRVVKAKVIGRDPTGMKAAKADRVSQHMSYQLLSEVPEWEDDLDTALHQLPIIGSAFKKVYRDESRESGFGDDLISAFDLVVNNSARSLETVPRVTHVFPLYPHEIEERMRDGRFLEVDLKLLTEEGEDSVAPTMFLEQHRYWDLDDDGLAEPWIVTVHEKTQTVVRIRAGYDTDNISIDYQRGRIVRIPRRQYFVHIIFLPDPEGGFYGIGFGKLLEPLSDVIDTAINQMMDAGTLQNAGGGFIGAGLQLGKSKVALKPGEYKVVGASGADIRNAIVNMEHPGPSTVLFQLLGLMIEAGKDIAAVKDILSGEMPRNQPATTTLAMIEQGLKVFTAIVKRIFRALKKEYKLIFDINRKYLNAPKYFTLLDDPIEIMQQDYSDQFDIEPAADPNMVMDMQRMVVAQLLLEQVEKQNPHINGFVATKRALEAARVEAVEEVLVPPPQEPSPAEQIQIAGAVAEVKDKEASAALKEAQTIKTQIEAGVAMHEPIADPIQPGAPDENGHMPPEPEMQPSLADIMPMMPPPMAPGPMPPPMYPEGNGMIPQ
jgi:chaperonin GroES